jgi:hypothetical protein
VPYAERYAHDHPGTGVIKIEWLDRVAESYKDAEQVFLDSRPKPGVFFGRWLSVATDAQLQRRIGNQRAALLVGLDKPCVMQNSNNYQGFFPEAMDSQTMLYGNHFIGLLTCLNWPYVVGMN